MSRARHETFSGDRWPRATGAPDVVASRHFASWLADRHAGIAISTYQSGSLLLAGLGADGRIALHRRALPRAMGLAADGRRLYVASQYQIWRFERIPKPSDAPPGFDRVYAPRASHVTGDVDAHDIGVAAGRRIIFANTLYSCLATVSQRFSFTPVWKPPFISKVGAEDRCHLNGVALRDGRIAHVTCVSESDAPSGWREQRRRGGCLIDVESDRIVLRGLSMPHSPRWHRGRLFLHNSGRGELGWADLRARRFVPICFLPGYLRGLAFLDHFAIVGVSKPRHNREFNGLELQGRLSKKRCVAVCALFVVDLRCGDAVHFMRFEGGVHELFDVAALPGCRRPMAIGFATDEIRRAIHIRGRRKPLLEAASGG